MANLTGWYYDNQLNNPLTSVSLHANMFPKKGEDGKVTWEEITKPINEEMTPEEIEETNPVADAEDCEIAYNNDKKKYYYNVHPICRSICNEDFIVNISNDWSDFGVDNIAGSLWNTIRQVGPYKSVIDSSIKQIIDNAKAKEEQYETSKDHSWGDYINHGVNWLATHYDATFGRLSHEDYFNKALIMQGTKFSYYGGSNVNFTNLGMKFTLFPKLDDNNNYIDVLTQASELYKYLIGSTEEFFTENMTQALESHNIKAPEIVKKTLLWQKAPMEFEPNLQQYDVIQKGTLKLKIGSLYSIANLVCNDANLVFSKQMVKLRNQIGRIELSPLYCDVAISLRPVSKYTERLLQNLISNQRTTHMNTEHDVNTELQKEVNAIRKNYGLDK